MYLLTKLTINIKERFQLLGLDLIYVVLIIIMSMNELSRLEPVRPEP